MAGIFICYRREDSGGYAGRLFDSLAEYFHPDDLVRDVDDVVATREWKPQIDAALAQCAAVVAVVGPAWLGRDAQGRRRIDDPEDFLRYELMTALERGKVLVPVLVGGARMPSPGELPTPLGPVAGWQALELSDARWVHDVGRIAAALRKVRGVRCRLRWWLRRAGAVSLLPAVVLMASVAATIATGRAGAPALPENAVPVGIDLLALGEHGGCIVPPACGTRESAARAREIEMRHADVATGGDSVYVAAELRWVLRGKPWGWIYRAYGVGVLYRVPVRVQGERVVALAPVLEAHRGAAYAGLLSFVGGWLEVPLLLRADTDVARSIEARVERIPAAELLRP